MAAQTSPEDRGAPERTRPKPYQEVTYVAYGEVAATMFEVEQPDRHTIVLRGCCPRCHHVMDFMISDQVVRRRTWFRFAGTDPGSEVAVTEEPMICTCAVDHPDRPPNSVGCGAYWNLELGRQ